MPTARQARYEGAQQDKTNRRLGALTVLSAIFLPLTLLAGIWGMNFQGMPELGCPWGYPVALGIMGAVAFEPFQWFRTHGWLR